MSPPPPPLPSPSKVKVKREPLGRTSEENHENESKEDKKGDKHKVKIEPVDDTVNEEEEEDLPPPDPSKPKEYRRIKVTKESSEDEGRTLDRLRSSDEEDEYVPLRPGGGTSSSGTSPDKQQNKEHVDNESPSISKSKGPSQKRKRTVRRRKKGSGSDSDSDSDSDWKEEGTGEQSEESEPSPSGSSCGRKSTLSDFIVEDDEQVSDEEEEGVSDSGSESNKKKTKRRRSPKTKKKARRRNKKGGSPRSEKRLRDSSESGVVSSTEDLCEKVPPRRKQKGLDDKHSSQHRKKRRSMEQERDLDYGVVTAVRGIMGQGAIGVSSKRGRHRSGSYKSPIKPKSSQFILECGNRNDYYDGGVSDEDDHNFINDDEKVQPQGLLQSSSSSDEDVEEEDPSNLEIEPEPENKGGESVSESEEGEEAQASEEQSDTNSEKSSDSSANSFIVYEEDEPLQSTSSQSPIKEKCLLCTNLGPLEVNHRDNEPDANWCGCGECKVFSPIMFNYDRVCCKDILEVEKLMRESNRDDLEDLEEAEDCITKHPLFPEVLKAKFSKKNCPLTDHEKIFNVGLSFTKWIFGNIDEDERMVVPACVMMKIRDKYAPTAGPAYFKPFMVKRLCKLQHHCLNVRNQI